MLSHEAYTVSLIPEHLEKNIKLPLLTSVIKSSCFLQQTDRHGIEPQDGDSTWIPREFSQVNVLCLQRWTCEPTSIIYDPTPHGIKTTSVK